MTPEGRRFGPFTIVRLLGRGSFGSVFEVHDPRLDRRAALKVLRAEAPGDLSATTAERFVREGEALARLRHPNVVRVHEAGSIDATPYVLMELVEGETLAARAARGDAPRERLLAMVVQVARGLHAAHQAGLVHRDVKPLNVVVDDALATARLVDFGVAHLPGLSSLTSTGDFVGTPAYVAPEALRGDEPGPLADVHGLGAMLFELLTGRPPYSGQSFLERYAGRGQVKDVRAVDPTVSPALAAVCARALADDPGRRWPDAAAFADALEAAAASRPATGRRTAVALGVSLLALGALLGLASAARPVARPVARPAGAPVAAVPSAAAGTSGSASGPRPAGADVAWTLSAAPLLEPVAGRHHHGPALCAAVSSGGVAWAVVVTGGSDGVVRVWRARDGGQLLARPVEPARARRPRVAAVAVRPDGAELVAMGGRTVRLRVSDGAELDAWPVAAEARGAPFDLQLSADGATALALSDGEARLLEAGRAPVLLGPERVVALALAPDGRTAALAHEDAVSVWDLARRERVERRALEAERGAPVALARGPGGELAVFFRNGRGVELVAGDAPRPLPAAGVGLVTGVVHLGGQLLVAGRAERVRTLERATSWRRGADVAVGAGSRTAALAPDGLALAQVLRDRVQLVELPSGAAAWPAAALPGGVDALLVDGPDVVVAGGGALVRLEGGAAAEAPPPARVVGRYDGQVVRPAQVAAGSALLLVAVPRRLPLEVEQQAVLVALEDGRTLGWWPAGDPPFAALALDGVGVACPELDGGLRRAGLSGEATPLRPPGPKDAARWLDARRLVSAGEEGLEVWDAAAGRRTVVEPAAGGAPVADLALAPGLVLVVRVGAPALVVSLAAGARPRALPGSEAARLGALAPDGRWAVVADPEGATAFDLRAGPPVRCGRLTLEAGDEATALAAVGPDALLVGTARGGLVRLRVLPAPWR